MRRHGSAGPHSAAADELCSVQSDDVAVNFADRRSNSEVNPLNRLLPLLSRTRAECITAAQWSFAAVQSDCAAISAGAHANRWFDSEVRPLTKLPFGLVQSEFTEVPSQSQPDCNFCPDSDVGRRPGYKLWAAKNHLTNTGVPLIYVLRCSPTMSLSQAFGREQTLG